MGASRLRKGDKVAHIDNLQGETYTVHLVQQKVIKVLTRDGEGRVLGFEPRALKRVK